MKPEIRELYRLIDRLMMPGIVQSVPKPGWVRVMRGEYVTGMLRVMQAASGKHRPITIGEQVLCLFPGGGEDGVALRCIPTETNDIPDGSAAGVTIDRYDDGTIIKYDEISHKLSATIQGSAEIAATGGVKITGDLTVTGNMSATGVSDATGSLAGLRENYLAHVHLCSAPGSNSGTPIIPPPE